MRRYLILLIALASISAFPEVASAQFPGANGAIAFSRVVSGGSGIATISSPGDAPAMLTESEGFDRQPSYSPDGSRIVFLRGTNVWVMNADGSGAMRLTRGRVAEQCPGWSPDGQMIVYERGRDLWTTGADVPDPHRLTDTPAFDEYCPSWSPDGSTIAFIIGGRRDHRWDLALMAPDGTDRRRITSDRLTQFGPDWAPDGSVVVFNEYDPFGIASIVTITPDGADRTVVFEGGVGGALDPVFSPDGLFIAFWRTTRDRSHVWTVGADGSDPTRMTHGSAYNAWPGWQPITAP